MANQDFGGVALLVPLTPAQSARLQTLEERAFDGIQRAALGAHQVAEALATIRRESLYLATHATFDSYIRDRFGKSGRWARYVLQAVHIWNDLEDGTIVPPTAMSQLRPLATEALDAGARVEIWNAAATRAGGAPTQRQVAEAAAAYQVERSPYTSIIQAMSSGQMAPGKALEIVNALDAVPAAAQQAALQHGVTSRGVIHELGRLAEAGRETFQELRHTGALQFAESEPLPLSQATPADLRRLLQERAAEHRQRAIDERIQGTAVSVVVYAGDAAASYTALRAVLSEKDLEHLAAEITRRLRKD